MKISELDFSRLSEEDKYELVMNGIKDLNLENPTEKTKSDLIVILGCTPIPLRARILKMMSLVNKGYSKNILLSGGGGWKKLYKKVDPQTGKVIINEEKRKTLLEAITKTISADLLGDNPTQKEKQLYDRFIEGMKKMGQEDHIMSYEENHTKKKLEMTEAEFMNLIIITNGGLKDVKILREPFSDNTRQNMENTKVLLDNVVERGELEKLNRMIIVTSSFHCRRAYLTFKKQFPNVDLLVCPATKDLEDKGLELGKKMLESDYYKQQINNECNAIINYSKNGSIYDSKLEEILPAEIAKRIEKAQVSKEI